MIILKLQGGLGNQMFQYAYGRSLSIKNKTGLLLDISEYEHNGKRKDARHFELGDFEINAQVATLFQRLNPFNKHIKGYFQSENYFKEIEALIRKEFTLTVTDASHLSPRLRDIRNSVSVSLHIRRTDYLADKNKKVYEQISFDYYSQAIEKIRLSVYSKDKDVSDVPHSLTSSAITPRSEVGTADEQLKIFIFSDDIEWVKSNLKLQSENRDLAVQYVSGSGLTSTEELYLMSQCQNNITANSTFSWWAAWLNSNPNKIVITPKKWFVDKDKEEEELIPKTWVRM